MSHDIPSDRLLHKSVCHILRSIIERDSSQDVWETSDLESARFPIRIQNTCVCTGYKR